MKLNEQYVGYMMLAASLSLPLLLAILTSSNPTIYAVNIARATESFSDFCRAIDIYGECKHYTVYAWIISRVSTGEVASIALLALSIVTVYVFTYKMLGSSIAGGLAALLYTSTPIILRGIRDHNGLFYTSMLIPLVLLLLYDGFNRGLRSPTTILGLALYTLLSLHPAHFILALSVSALLLLMYARGESMAMNARRILVLLIAVNSGVLAASATGLVQYNPFTVATTMVAVLSLLVSHQKTSLASYRALVVVMVALTSVAVFLLELSVVGVKPAGYFNTIVQWGFAGFIGLPGALFIAKRKASVAEYHVALLTMLLAPTSVFSMSLCIPFVAVASASASRLLVGFHEFTRSVDLSSKLQKPRFISAGILFSAILASYVGTFAINPIMLTYNTPMREVILVAGEQPTKLSEVLTALEHEIVNSVRADLSDRKLIVIATPDNAYWAADLFSRNGFKVQLLASPDSGESSRNLLARLLTSDEDTVLRMLEYITVITGVSEVYLILVYPYTAREAHEYVYIGVPREITMTYMGRTYPLVILEGYEDLALLPSLLVDANKTLGDYFVLMGLERERATAVSWNMRGASILLPQLVVKALRDQGYRVYNYMVGFELNSTIRYFDLVFAKSIEITRISTTYHGVYTVYYMVSVFRYRGGVSHGVAQERTAGSG
ncbi:MAG: hypothetical protein QW081_00910 [Desulfurococcaceae archaeon]